MTAAGSSIYSPPTITPFASLFEAHEEIYRVPRNVTLIHFLFLVIHQNTYVPLLGRELKKREVLRSTHPFVHKIISKLAQTIMAGAPPLYPPIPIEHITPRLKLTGGQKAYLEIVLIEGVGAGAARVNPPLLKDLRGGTSPFSLVANMAAAGSSLYSPPTITPFASLLEAHGEIYRAPQSVTLIHFLFLVIHQNTYARILKRNFREREFLYPTHPVVRKVISKLAQTIMAGAPPLYPPIPIDHITPRLKLTVEQKAYLEIVLIEGVGAGAARVNPPLLKDFRDGTSPFSLVAKKGSPWSRSGCSRFQASGRERSLAIRRSVMQRWVEVCFVIRKDLTDNIKYASAVPNGPLLMSSEIISDFIYLVVPEKTQESERFDDLLLDLQRRKVFPRKNSPSPGEDKVVADVLLQIVVPTLVSSGLPLLQPAERAITPSPRSDADGEAAGAGGAGEAGRETKREARGVLLRGWLSRCFSKKREGGKIYFKGKRNGPLEGSRTLIKDFIIYVVEINPSDPKFSSFLKSLMEKGVSINRTGDLPAEVILEKVLPTLLESQVSFFPLPE